MTLASQLPPSTLPGPSYAGCFPARPGGNGIAILMPAACDGIRLPVMVRRLWRDLEMVEDGRADCAGDGNDRSRVFEQSAAVIGVLGLKAVLNQSVIGALVAHLTPVAFEVLSISDTA